MRKLALSLLLCGTVPISFAAWSQEPAPTTPEDFVCAFAGDCGDEAAEEEAPARAPGAPRVTATRGFSVSPPAGSSRPNAARRPPRRPGAATQRRPALAAIPRRPAAAQGQRVNLSLAFESGSAKLTADAVRQAQVFGQALMLPQLANMRFRIEGHTDSIGSRASNLDLSRRRAESVAEFLVTMGVPRDRLDVRGYGPDQPLAGTRASEPQNRRVEAVRIS